MAGAFAATATPALAAGASVSPQNMLPPALDFDGLLVRSREHMLGLLSSVRRAPGADSRGAAFDQFKTAFAMHEYTRAMAANGDARAARSLSLYRQEDPDQVLARVIVRELDTWPKTDAGWIRRFADLESIVQQKAA